MMIKNKYLLPRIDNLFDQIARFIVFSFVLDEQRLYDHTFGEPEMCILLVP